MAQHVKITETTDYMLTEMSKDRKNKNKLIRTKQDIAAEAISLLWKKEQREKR